MRSLRIDRPVDDVMMDLRDGVVLLQIIDRLRPGTVDWKRVHQRPRNAFQRIENLNHGVELCDSVLKLHITNMSGKDVFDGNRTLTLALLSQLLRYSIDQSVGGGDAERTLIEWANSLLEKCGQATISGLRDPTLRTAIPQLHIAQLLFPKSGISLESVNKGSSELECMENAAYLISALWRAGVPVLASALDVAKARPTLLLHVFAVMNSTAKQS